MICKPFSLFNWFGNQDMSRANNGSEQTRWPQQCPDLVVVREFGNLEISGYSVHSTPTSY